MTASAYGLPPLLDSPRVWPAWPTEPAAVPPASVAPNPPPSYADDAELQAITALSRLTPEQAARVIAWACGKFGVPGPVALGAQVERDGLRAKLDAVARRVKAWDAADSDGHGDTRRLGDALGALRDLVGMLGDETP